MTSHDIHIKNHVQGLWPEECSKNTYPGLRKFACLACSPEQPKYTYTKKDVKIIRICESLLREFYGNGEDVDAMTRPTSAFQQCGAWSDPDTTLVPLSSTDVLLGYKLDKPDPSLIFPESAFATAENFYNEFK